MKKRVLRNKNNVNDITFTNKFDKLNKIRLIKIIQLFYQLILECYHEPSVTQLQKNILLFLIRLLIEIIFMK